MLTRKAYRGLVFLHKSYESSLHGMLLHEYEDVLEENAMSPS